MLVANNVPPVEALYQRMEFPLTPGVAFIVPVPHKVVLDAVGAAGTALIVTVTACLGVLAHPVVVL